jgi:hypothetical protein
METTANAPAGTGPAMTVPLNVHDARCGALFVSGLEPSDARTAGSVTESISRAVRRFGTRGCAGRGTRVRRPPRGRRRADALGPPIRCRAGRPPACQPGPSRLAGPQLAARAATAQREDGAGMNETCDRCGPAADAAYRVHRRGERHLGQHCTSRLRAALCARGWTIWPVVRARRARQARHGLLLRCPAIAPKTTLVTDEGT